jgi:hypothetical protein
MLEIFPKYIFFIISNLIDLYVLKFFELNNLNKRNNMNNELNKAFEEIKIAIIQILEIQNGF